MYAPIGEQDFIEMRRTDSYYVDKSLLIKEIVDKGLRGTFLFTRPRRFGKSLNLSMLNTFFNIEYKGNSWFDGLKISDHDEYDRFKNRYPVIHFSFANTGAEDYEGFIRRIRSRIGYLYRKYPYLKKSEELSKNRRKMFKKICKVEGQDYDPVQSLEFLSEILHRHHGKKVIVLIDEYDMPMNNTYGNKDSEKTVGFMRELLSSILKGNDDVQMAVVTGVMQVAKESLFSGLNNLYVNNVFSTLGDEMFGFTDEEVRQICVDFGKGNNEEDERRYRVAKEWYDGYRFGNADVYNPWSVLSYIERGFVPGPYWAHTTTANIVTTLINRSDKGMMDDLKTLGEGKTVTTGMDFKVIYGSLAKDHDAVFSVLTMSGYLNAKKTGDRYELSIPNKEVFEVFKQDFLEVTFGQGNIAMDFMDAVRSDDTVKMTKTLCKMMMDSMSVRILTEEKVYRGFIMGLTMLAVDTYRITGDFESGYGYHDIRMENTDGRSPNVLMELKMLKDGESPEHSTSKALEQIHSKRYYNGLEGRTVLYGVTFDGKRLYISSEEGVCGDRGFVPS